MIGFDISESPFNLFLLRSSTQIDSWSGAYELYVSFIRFIVFTDMKLNYT